MRSARALLTTRLRYNPQTGQSEILQSGVRREPIEILSLAGGKESVYAGGFLNGGVSIVDPSTGAATFNRFSQTEALLEASEGKVWIGNYPEARRSVTRLHHPLQPPPGGPRQRPTPGHNRGTALPDRSESLTAEIHSQ